MDNKIQREIVISVTREDIQKAQEQRKLGLFSPTKDCAVGQACQRQLAEFRGCCAQYVRTATGRYYPKTAIDADKLMSVVQAFDNCKVVSPVEGIVLVLSEEIVLDK